MADPTGAIEGALAHVGRRLDLAAGVARRGSVARVGDGVAIVAGLDDVGLEELLEFDSGALGMAFDLGETATGAILLTRADRVAAGDGVRGLHRLPGLPVGPSLLGRIVDPLGNPLDEGPPPARGETWPLFRPAPEIIERVPVDQPLWTGVMAIDAAIPIGRGQRELIVGDRNVGKTSLALDIVAAQRPGDVVCVYVVIGQPMSRVLAVREVLDQAGRLRDTAIIAAEAAASPGLQHLAPYAGAALAEWFRAEHRDALVVYDDLTKHADSYRELALLLDRPPGREAFPGDIFHIHAELLERAAATEDEGGRGSVTALPLIETTEGDLSAYIPTNLISITDGQIHLDSARFERNERPAIDVGRSVSRIGGLAQSPGMRHAAKNLRIDLSRFESLESLTRVGLDMDEGMQAALRRGRILRAVLRQDRLEPRDEVEQILTLIAVREGWLEAVPAPDRRPYLDDLVRHARRDRPAIAERLASGQPLDETDLSALRELADRLRPAAETETP